jgi:GAF domain-containing protein
VITDERLLLRTLVELADTLVEDFDVVDLLTHLADRSVAVLDVAAAGVLLASQSGSLRVVASSSEALRVLELYELQADEGPCVDCYRAGEPVVDLDLASGTAWPLFVSRALAAGFRSVHALPLRLRGRTIGALNMFRADPGGLDDDAVAAAQALADVATIAVLQHQGAIDAQDLNVQLLGALNTRIVIEQAKGRVSQSAGVDMDQAFKRLRAHARNHNLHLSQLAADVAAGRTRPEGLDPLRPS